MKPIEITDIDVCSFRCSGELNDCVNRFDNWWVKKFGTFRSRTMLKAWHYSEKTQRNCRVYDNDWTVISERNSNGAYQITAYSPGVFHDTN